MQVAVTIITAAALCAACAMHYAGPANLLRALAIWCEREARAIEARHKRIDDAQQRRLDALLFNHERI